MITLDGQINYSRDIKHEIGVIAASSMHDSKHLCQTWTFHNRSCPLKKKSQETDFCHRKDNKEIYEANQPLDLKSTKLDHIYHLIPFFHPKLFDYPNTNLIYVNIEIVTLGSSSKTKESYLLHSRRVN